MATPPQVLNEERKGMRFLLIFLYLNGFDFAEMVPAVARGDLDKADVAVFIRRHTRPT